MPTFQVSKGVCRGWVGGGGGSSGGGVQSRAALQGSLSWQQYVRPEYSCGSRRAAAALSCVPTSMLAHRCRAFSAAGSGQAGPPPAFFCCKPGHACRCTDRNLQCGRLPAFVQCRCGRTAQRWTSWWARPRSSSRTLSPSTPHERPQQAQQGQHRVAAAQAATAAPSTQGRAARARGRQQRAKDWAMLARCGAASRPLHVVPRNLAPAYASLCTFLRLHLPAAAGLGCRV